MMKIILSGAAALLTTTALAVPATAQSINAAYEYTSAGTLSDTRDFTLGFAFSLSNAQSVNALGYNTLNLTGDQTVGLWDSTGNLLASATVGTSSAVTGNYAWSTIAPLNLGAGTYRIGGTFTGGDFVSNLAGVTTAPGFTWLTDYQQQGAGLLFPTVTTNNFYGQNGIALVNLSLGGGVPEPATWALMILGMGAVGGALRRRQAAKTSVRFA